MLTDYFYSSLAPFTDGGTGASGEPCEALHYHGYIGMEKETVDQIVSWIRQPTQ